MRIRCSESEATKIGQSSVLFGRRQTARRSLSICPLDVWTQVSMSKKTVDEVWCIMADVPGTAGDGKWNAGITQGNWMIYSGIRGKR